MSIHFVELAKKYVTPCPRTAGDRKVAIVVGGERLELPEQETLELAKAQWTDAHEIVKQLLMQGAVAMRQHG